MEPGPLGDRQKMECRAQYDMKGAKTECQCHQLLFFQNDTLSWQLAMAWRRGQPTARCHRALYCAGRRAGPQSQAPSSPRAGDTAAASGAGLATGRRQFLTSQCAWVVRLLNSIFFF